MTSGYLVTASLLARGDVFGFVMARALRILPGLIVAICATVFICGLFFSSLPVKDFFLDGQTWRYLVKNIVMFRGTEWILPGVFENIPTAVNGVRGGAVNGSLWTLFLEIKMYAYLAVIYSICRWWARRSDASLETPTATNVLTLFGLACLAYNLVANLDHREHQLSGLLSMFFVGAAMFCQRTRIQMRWSMLLAAAATVLAAALFGTPRIFGGVYVLTLPYIVLAGAQIPGGFIRRFNLLGNH